MEDFGILVFGHQRELHLNAVLESLRRQGGIDSTYVWVDGHQGNPGLKARTDRVAALAAQYDVAGVMSHNGHLGFRKLLLHALLDAQQRFKHFLVLEDDCFPTADAVTVFRETLREIEHDDSIFSVYGSHFLVAAEGRTCSRFQGWGWATTADKMAAVLPELIELYSLPESVYLARVAGYLDDGTIKRLDVTPPRQPSDTLRRFFAWDETLALICARRGLVHRPTSKRTIYNCGVGDGSTHFREIDWYRQPPFNMIRLEEVWDKF